MCPSRWRSSSPCNFTAWIKATLASHGASLPLFLVLVFAAGIGAYQYFELPWKQTIKSALLRRADERSPVALAH